MFKKLKSLFVVEGEPGLDENLEDVSIESIEDSTGISDSSSQETTINTSDFDSSEKGPAKPQKKFTSILLKAMESNNLEGIDYLEFKESLQSLKKVIEDEPTRFKSSFAVLSNSGVTKQKLVDSSDHYIKVLQKEKSKFESTFKAQQTKKVNAREKQIKDLKEGILKRKQTLQKLINEIEAMEKSLGEAKVEINQVASKVQLTKDQFMASYQMIIKQIQSDSDKINKYLS